MIKPASPSGMCRFDYFISGFHQHCATLGKKLTVNCNKYLVLRSKLTNNELVTPPCLCLVPPIPCGLVLLATATIALCFPRRRATDFAQQLSVSSRSLAQLSTALAPYINKKRNCVLPRLLMPLNCTRPPVPYCFGTSPSQADS